jgi:hypothetical protein
MFRANIFRDQVVLMAAIAYAGDFAGVAVMRYGGRG